MKNRSGYGLHANLLWRGSKLGFCVIGDGSGGEGGEYVPVMVKMDPPKLVPPGTNFLINKDPLELILLKNLDPL